jgi:hypothetical protein
MIYNHMCGRKEALMADAPRQEAGR